MINQWLCFRMIYDHEWFWKKRLGRRKGQKCRILTRSKRMNSILVEFEDGEKVITSRWAVRKIKNA
jgi:hypothetical protein